MSYLADEASLLTLAGMILRFAILVCVAAALMLGVEPTWDAPARSLTLRIRTFSEARQSVHVWGERVRHWARAERRDTDVAGGPADRLTDEDRARLDRLVEEKLRE